VEEEPEVYEDPEPIAGFDEDGTIGNLFQNDDNTEN